MTPTIRLLHKKFRDTCRSGDLPTLQHLVSLKPIHGKIDIHVEDECAFQITCANGHLPVVDYLLSLEPTHGKIDIHAKNERAFKATCLYGHLPVLEKILGLESTHGRIDIHINDDLAFKQARAEGHENIVTKLLAIQHSYGIIDSKALKDYGDTFDISDFLEPAFASHSLQEAQRCLAELATVTTIPAVKNTIRRIFAAKAKAHLTDQKIASPALRP